MVRKEKIRIGLIGAGSFACRYHIPNLLKRDDAELISICRRSDDKRRLIQQKFRVPAAYSDYHEMLEKEELEGIIISSPHHVHDEQIKACFERGLPVLVEKPMTIDADRAQELHEYAEECSIPFLVGYNRRVDNRYREAAKLIQNGKIGDIRFLEAHLFVDLEWMLTGQLPPTEDLKEKWWPDADRPNFRSDKRMIGEGFLDDGGSHAIDAMLWLSGSHPTEVTALMHSLPSGLEIRSSVTIVFENGALASISCSADTPAIIPYETIVYGSEGAIALSRDHFLHVYQGKQFKPKTTFPPLTTTGNFIDVLMEKDEILCSSGNAVKAVEIARAAFQSHHTGRSVRV